jgi:hypothetical protein
MNFHLCLLLFLIQSHGLTNKEVVELIKLGLSPEVIVAKVSKSGCNFDTSPKALLELKNAGVPDAITLAMIQAPCERIAAIVEPKKGVRELYEVRRIYVDEMGKSDDAERFRLLLGEKLSEHFTVVEKPEDADAILKGAVSTQLAQGTTKARASVSLMSSNGQRLWSDDFGVRMVFGLGKRDSIKLRAEDVANGYTAPGRSPQRTRKSTNSKTTLDCRVCHDKRGLMPASTWSPSRDRKEESP